MLTNNVTEFFKNIAVKLGKNPGYGYKTVVPKELGINPKTADSWMRREKIPEDRIAEIAEIDVIQNDPELLQALEKCKRAPKPKPTKPKPESEAEMNQKLIANTVNMLIDRVDRLEKKLKEHQSNKTLHGGNEDPFENAV